MLTSLLHDLWPYLAAAGGVIVAVLAAYVKGVRKTNAKHRAKQAKDRQDTKDRMDEVDLPDDDAGVDEWLRSRGGSKRDL